MLKVAVLGANGFVGSRLVEILHLNEIAEVRPVVRRFESLVRCSRFKLDWRIADALDEQNLCRAFQECEIVVHAAVGNPDVIIGSISPVYRAAEKAGVKRIIYLSSSAVHGQAPAKGTDESAELTATQPLAYNNAKVRAEKRLTRCRKRGHVETVVLRPGIVYGPRSRWTAGTADDLLSGNAYLINAGSGICNSIYVDNLINAIVLAFTSEQADGHAFLVGDDETVTWLDLYRPIADALGIDLEPISSVALPEFKPSFWDLAEQIRASGPVQTVLPIIPDRLKQSIKAGLSSLALNASGSSWSISTEKSPVITQEMALLQQCEYKLPFDRARRMLGYQPTVKFIEGCRRSVAWLKFAGYPVQLENNLPSK